MEKLEQTIGCGKQPFPRLYLVRSLSTQRFTEITSFSWAKRLLYVTFS